LSDGVTEKVLSELELEGDDDICTQLKKLLDDTCKEPTHAILEVLVVTDEVSIASEKVTVMLSTIIALKLSGETEETVGAVVSEVVVLVEVVLEDVLSVDADEPPSSLPQEIMVRLNRKTNKMCKILSIIASIK
jgi:hypothetical protein